MQGAQSLVGIVAANRLEPLCKDQTHVMALELLLSERPHLSTREFGEKRVTLLHVVCLGIAV